MTMLEREGLIARVRHLRRIAVPAPARPAAPAAPASGNVVDLTRMESLEARVEHLEHLLEGFQDSVHRESQRSDKRIADLEAITQPGALVAALSKDARERGL
jgi:hypothetical protein